MNDEMAHITTNALDELTHNNCGGKIILFSITSTESSVIVSLQCLKCKEQFVFKKEIGR